MPDPAPFVSIVVPCWNAAGVIERSLASVLDDHELPIECVVVDDASTDGSVDVVEAIAARDPRVVLLRAPDNRGVSAARNLGLDVVRGEWISFLDADDHFMPGGLDAMAAVARSTDALAVIGQRILSDGERTWIPKLYDQPDAREPGRKSLERNPGLMFTASVTGKFFHSTCATGLRFEGRILGDQPWALRALLRAGDRIEVIGDTVYEWTRPSPANPFVSITAAKRESAARAADAVAVAVGALRAVSAEAELLLRSGREPQDRHLLLRPPRAGGLRGSGRARARGQRPHHRPPVRGAGVVPRGRAARHRRRVDGADRAHPSPADQRLAAHGPVSARRLLVDDPGLARLRPPGGGSSRHVEGEPSRHPDGASAAERPAGPRRERRAPGVAPRAGRPTEAVAGPARRLIDLRPAARPANERVVAARPPRDAAAGSTRRMGYPATQW